ncbi:MAG: DUF1839 family protein [Deltaproteobacteria bacterium]|nr:DUF1839 family protein [Deltaproteobacteria bacterium]
MNVLDLDVATYRRHPLHADTLAWMEKNCYFDIWIETLHALRCEPMAMIPGVVALDFEGDQWTFFKPSHDELRDLYGVEVTEMTCWRPLLEHAIEHLGAGKLISTETDAWWLPDVSGTDYRTHHVKTTIVMADLDVDARRLGYFHNAGYYTLDGEDFDQTFRVGTPHDPEHMPFFAELVRLERVVRRPMPELVAMSGQLLAKHYARRAADNPIVRFAARFQRDLPMLQERGLANYHAWAFATVRQLGAAAELMQLYLRWLAGGGEILAADAGQYAPAVAAYTTISTGAKSFILKAARAVNGKKAFDPTAIFDAWAKAWDQAMTSLAIID